MNFISLKRKLKLRWESKLTGMSSRPVLIWVFINQKRLLQNLHWVRKCNSTQLEEKYQTHLVNKIIAYDTNASQKLLPQNNPQSIACLVFYRQKVLNVPSDENGLFYYTRKLTLYNLIIADLVNKDWFCYTWGETTAKRGANEIGSCIYFDAKQE